MEQIQERIAYLESRIQEVIQKQEEQNAEILELVSALKALRQQLLPLPEEQPKPVHKAPLPPFIPAAKPRASWFKGSDKAMEDLIGRNLINRIGILVTVIGIFIGAKYAIDKNLISPAMRIILGYLMYGALSGVAIYLRKKYMDYSAVLMSGAVAIFYFITYIGFSFYQLFPQLTAFGVMFVATSFAVGMALWYNNRFIALMGQVGAYAIPFLLSTGTGNIMFLLAYMCVVNTGLLILSFKKDWRQIYQIAFYVSWIIFIASNPWQQKEYGVAMKLAVLSAQMLIFYGAFLAYKLVRNESYKLQEVVVLLINSFIYYVIGQSILKGNFTNVAPVTIFALANAGLYFITGFVLMKREVQDKSLQLFLLGLGVSFLTISIPVAFKGNVITILWAVEMLVLGFVAYRSQRGIYLSLSNALLLLTIVSLVMDWQNVELMIESKKWFTPFLNKYFASSVVAVLSFGGLTYLSRTKALLWEGRKDKYVQYIIPLLFIATGYFTILLELDHIWKMRTYDPAFYVLRIPVALLFTMIYFSLWQYVNEKRFQHKELAIVLLVVSVYTIFYSLIIGLNAIGEMRSIFLQQHLGTAITMLGFRYIWMVALGVLILFARKGLAVAGLERFIHRGFYIVVNITILTLLGNEFIHWMEVAGQTGQYALGLSIISGLYALVLLFIGIRRQLQYIRVSAIVLLGLTLVKLFLYDLASLSTISKTLVLIILGVILLIASFLYTKYKDSIMESDTAVKL